MLFTAKFMCGILEREKMSLAIGVLNKRFTSMCFNYIYNYDQKNLTVIRKEIGSGNM